jgi:hypothetical protein
MSIREANANRVLQLGNTNAERVKNNMINLISREFSSSPSYHEVLRNNIPQGIQIIDENALTKNPNKKRVLCKPDEDINIGDDILWNSQHWLCTNVDSDKEIYAKGIIERCNNTLKFYKNQTLHSIPCIFTEISLDLQEGKFMNVPIGHYLVYIPSGIITKSDMNLRFLLNDSAYKIEGISDATNGLIKIELSDDEINVKDDLINGIAWNEGHNPNNNYTVEILNGAEQTIKYGETLTLNVRVENNGVLVTPTPTLTYETSDGTKCTVNSSGVILATNSAGSAIVTVRLASDTNISANITIIDSPSAVVNYSYTLTGNVQPDSQILYNQTRTFTAVKYDSSNNVVPTQFLFSVVGNTPTDKYLLTVLNDTQCLVKCLGYVYTITLRAMDISNIQFVDKNINLKSLM